MTDSIDSKDGNLDPITGTPGAHPVGVGVGAMAGGLAAGAAAGTLAAGPVGTAVGAVIGAVVGGLGGKAVAEKIDPTFDANDWRAAHAGQPYHDPSIPFEEYEPAYRLGGQPRTLYANKAFDEVEPHLAADYAQMKGASSLTWEQARHAVRAAWDRVSTSGSTS